MLSVTCGKRVGRHGERVHAWALWLSVTVRSMPPASYVHVDPIARSAASASSGDSTRRAVRHDLPNAEEVSVTGGMMRT
jgi:hypothetical protein